MEAKTSRKAATRTGLSFSCGAQLQDASLPEHLKILSCQTSCEEPTEKLYYSAKFTNISYHTTHTIQTQHCSCTAQFLHTVKETMSAMLSRYYNLSEKCPVRSQQKLYHSAKFTNICVYCSAPVAPWNDEEHSVNVVEKSHTFPMPRSLKLLLASYHMSVTFTFGILFRQCHILWSALVVFEFSGSGN